VSQWRLTTADPAAVAGGGEPLLSGPLHDSAALAQAGIPATMLFTPSIGGISHTRDEDTFETDLVCALEAFAALTLELAGARARGDEPPAIS
jgi:N-carbamoyl-L-amino-acid hydrolase